MHRLRGRTGRVGSTGRATLLFIDRDMVLLSQPIPSFKLFPTRPPL
jgi:superfamily II DNA/RNA helicase